jgi:hypothetical protein
MSMPSKFITPNVSMTCLILSLFFVDVNIFIYI